MRILVWGLSNARGGIENFLINYIEIIQRLRQDIIFDTIGYTEPINCNYIKKNKGDFYIINGDKASYLENFFKNNAHKYDCFWVNVVSLTDLSHIKSAKKHGIKRIIVHSHSSYIMSTGVKRYYHLLKHYCNRLQLANYASDLWACSDKAAKWMFRKNDFKTKGVYIVNAIDTEKFRFDEKTRTLVRNEFGWNDKIIYAFIGRLCPEKDPFFAVDVYRNLISENHNSRLVFIGNEEMRDVVQQYVDKIDINDYVDFLGERNDVYRLYQGIDAVLLTSNFEGFPMVLVESQASGTQAFVSWEAVTKQVALTDKVKFIRKGDGPEKWAKIITDTCLNKEDLYGLESIQKYDYHNAALHLLSLLSQD